MTKVSLTNTNSFNGMALYKHQREVAEKLLSKEDVLLISPTGSGKSVCYLLPTSITKLPTIVISPLIALMDDQANNARSFGFKAEALHGGISAETQWRTLARWISDDLQIVFISPERLQNPKIIKSLLANHPGLLVIDEVHCLPTWGINFRPSYQKLSEIIQHFRPAPVLAMTATATASMQSKIIQGLGLSQPETVCVPFSFPNLTIRTKQIPCFSERLAFIEEIAKDSVNHPLIVFCQTRGQTEKVADYLVERKIKTLAYHSGKVFKERSAIFSSFREAGCVLSTTSAFEMGINIPGIKTIIHFGLPFSLASYVQAIGRAGRGTETQRSSSILLYNDSDLDRLDYMLNAGGNTGDQYLINSSTLREMLNYAKSPGCRVSLLNRYFFSSAVAKVLPCGRCDNCENHQNAYSFSTRG